MDKRGCTADNLFSEIGATIIDRQIAGELNRIGDNLHALARAVSAHRNIAIRNIDGSRKSCSAKKV
jgi:hypothetical protein